jgi:hypothetical protein
MDSDMKYGKNVAIYILSNALKDAADYFEQIGDTEFAEQMASAKYALEVLCRNENT